MKARFFFTTALALCLTALFGSAQAAQSTSSMTQEKSAQAASDAPAKSMNSSKSQYAEINGTRIHYQVAGRGEPLLLIHGFPLNGDLFAKQRQDLSHQFKVITPDLPGFGRSDALENKATLTSYAQIMFGLLDELGIDKAIIGGHSMGGMTALEMYKLQPQRFAGLVLIDTAAIAAPLPRKGLWQGFAKLAQQSGNHTKTMNNLLIPDMLSADARMHNPKLVKHMEKLVKAASTAGVVGGANALANRSDHSKLLAKIDVPTLIIVGTEDTITPVPLAKNMQKAIKGSTLEVIDGASHAAILEGAEQANRAIAKTMGTVRTRTASTML